MKKLIRVLLVIAAVIALYLLLLAVQIRYQEYKTKQLNDRTHAANVQAADKVKLQTQLSDLEKSDASHLSALKAECDKGAAAYALLPTLSQRKIAAPNCGI